MEYYRMSLSLKEKIAHSQRVNQLTQEASIYEDAIKNNSKFSEYYKSKLEKLNDSLYELNSSLKT